MFENNNIGYVGADPCIRPCDRSHPCDLISRNRQTVYYGHMGIDLPNRQSIRLRDYDYSQNGAYFVTICAQDRKCLFGDIVDGKMILNDIGKMIDKWWHKLEEKFPHITLD